MCSMRKYVGAVEPSWLAVEWLLGFLVSGMRETENPHVQ